jgi:hypothetical protein
MKPLLSSLPLEGRFSKRIEKKKTIPYIRFQSTPTKGAFRKRTENKPPK